MPRLVVGISRSRASWWALAWATGEARRRRARLLLVHVFRPSSFPVLEPETGECFVSMPRDPDASRMEYGYTLIQAAIAQALGQIPGDIAVEKSVVPGRAAVELSRFAQGSDVLVLGSRHRGWLRRHAPGSVARACARRADCPVVIVPEPMPSALTTIFPADSAHGHWFRWMPHRGARIAS
jgi:nucleotide-binding universal stress UspA family protein